MSSPISNKADAVKLPGSVASARGTFRLSVSGTAASFAIPADFLGNYLRLKARGATVQVGVGTTQTLVYDATNTDLTDSKATVGYTLADGESVDGIVPKNATHLNVVASGAGKLELFISELAGF